MPIVAGHGCHTMAGGAGVVNGGAAMGGGGVMVGGMGGGARIAGGMGGTVGGGGMVVAGGAGGVGGMGGVGGAVPLPAPDGAPPGCAGACGGAEAICCTAQGSVTNMTWKMVGPGQGRYEAMMNYNYVGQGGSYELQEVRTPYGWKVRPMCVGLVALVLVVLLVQWFSGGDSTTTTPAVLGPPGSCLMWGDPHVETFDKAFANFYGEGEFWIVKSPEVHVQGRYLATPFTNGLSATHQVVVGGPFLKGHSIQVGPMDDGQITFDGQVILPTFPSSFTLPDNLGSVSFDGQGTLLDEGMAETGMQKKIVHMNLPDQTHLQVMRWANHLNVKIVMAPRGQQDGACGNFNNNPTDDSTAMIKARMQAWPGYGPGGRIPQTDLMFHAPAQVAPPQPRPTLADCPADKKAQAEQSCKQADPAAQGALEESCVFDVCFGGPQYAAEDGLEERQAV